MLLATKFSSVSLRMYDVGTLIFRPNNFFGQNLPIRETALLCVTHDSSQKKSPFDSLYVVLFVVADDVDDTHMLIII